METGAGSVLSGREGELARALARLAATDGRHGLVLSGAAGIGKSRLADEISERAPSDWHRQRVVATPATASIPFGAFSHLLEDAPEPSHRLEPPDLLWALRSARSAIREASSDRPLLLVVDDAHALDSASATLVHQVAVAGDAHLIVVARNDVAVPDPVTALWRDELCELLVLGPLSRDEVGELAAGLLGTWLEAASIDRLFETSGGNPLFVRELVADAIAEGQLSTHRGLLRWSGVGEGPRLVALISRDLERLDDPSSSFIDALAVGEPIPLAAARRLASREHLGALESRGVVRIDPTGEQQVRFRNPLFGEVRRAHLGVMDRELRQLEVAEALEEAGCKQPNHRVRITQWRLDAGIAVDPVELLDAAGHARSLGDDELAERLVRHAHEAAPTPESDLALAELLEATGRPYEAAALLDGLAERLPGDAARARALTVQLRVLTHGTRQPDAAEAAMDLALTIVDPVWRGYVEAQWATLLSMLGRLDDAGRLGTDLFAHGDDRVRLRALPAVNLAAFATGRLDDALAAAESMVAPALAHRDEVPVGLNVVFSALALDLLALGRLDDLDALRALATDPVAASAANHAYLLLVEGTVALRRGRVTESRRAFAGSVAAFDRADPQGYRPAALSLLSQACAYAGDRVGAVDASREARALLAGRPRRMIDHDSSRTRAWALVVDGDLAGARRRLLEGARTARRDGYAVFEADALHDAIRLGAGRRAQQRLVEVATGIDGDRARAQADHALALIRDDARALEDAATSFEQLGELLVAAEICREAARRHREGGTEPAARRVARRAQSLAARCPGSVAHRDPGVTFQELTPRELQVAHLAAAGRSSQGIAEELSISRRTVDNQLSRAYQKLGVSGRGELPDALGLNDATVPPGG